MYLLIIVLSKSDQTLNLSDRIEKTRSFVPCNDVVTVPSLTGDGLDQLRQSILEYFSYPIEMEFFLPILLQLNL